MRLIRWLFRLVYRFVLTYFIVSVLVVGFAALAPSLWSPPIIRYIERTAREKLDVILKLGNIHFVRIWPVTLRFGEWEIEKTPVRTAGTIKAIDFSWSFERVDKNWLRPKIVLAVAMVEPNLKYDPPPEKPAKPGGAAESAEGSSFAMFNPTLLGRPKVADFNISVAVYRGNFEMTGSQPTALLETNFMLQIPSLRAAEWSPLVKFDATIQTTAGKVPIVLPVELELYPTTITESEWKAEKIRLSLAKLEFTGKGFYSWHGDYDYKLDLKATDLKRIPPSFLPPGQWVGEFQGGLRLDRQAMGPPRLAVSVESQNLKGKVNWHNTSGAHVEGEVAAQTRLKLVYAETLTMDDSTFVADLTNSEVSYGTWFKKTKGTEMTINVVGDAVNQRINLRRAQFRLAQMRFDAFGDAPLVGGKGKITLSLPPTSLIGLEQMIPALEKSPIQGIVMLDASGVGELSDLKGWDFEIKKLAMMGLRGRVDFGFGALTIQGPLSGQATVRARIKAMAVESAGWDATGDLTYLNIAYGSQFKKPPGFNLKLFSVGQRLGNQYSFEKLRLVGDGGDINVRGSVSTGYEYPLSLTANLAPLNVRSWLEILKIKDLRMLGEVSGALALNGKWIPKEGITTTPLQVTGRLRVKDGFLEYHSPPAVKSAVDDKKSKATMPEVIEPLLPNWPVIRTANVSLESSFKQIIFNDISMTGVSHAGQWQMGQWKGSAHVQNWWGGQVEINDLVLSLLASPPSVEAKVVLKDIQAGPAVEWLKPKLKGYIIGRASGDLSVLGAIPTKAVGFSQLKADGKFELKDAELKTVNLDEMINKELKKLGAGSSSVKNQPLPFSGRAEFLFEDSQLHIEKFQLATARRDELTMRGLIDDDLSADLTGQVALSSVRLGGSIAQANADSQGRLVVPMQIKGTLMQPNFLISDTTIKKMLTKTLEKEAGKYLKKLLGK